MVRKAVEIVAFLVLVVVFSGFLSGCSTTKNIPPGALIKLPQKKVVRLTRLTPVKPVSPQLRREEKLIETSIIQGSPTPIWIPPVITKVLILPYVDKSDALHGSQYVFLILRKGRWLIGNYLVNSDGEVKVFNPLGLGSSSETEKMRFTLHKANISQGHSVFQPAKTGNRTRQELYYKNTLKAMESSK